MNFEIPAVVLNSLPHLPTLAIGTFRKPGVIFRITVDSLEDLLIKGF
jgi:hypothetical protein